MDTRAAGRTVQVIAVVALFLSLLVMGRQIGLTNCVADYNDKSARASGARLAAAEQDRKALDVMIAEIAGARLVPPDEAGPKVSRALDTYLSARNEADKQRQRNPPPPPPSQSCR
jgi:hypothetical protein